VGSGDAAMGRAGGARRGPWRRAERRRRGPSAVWSRGESEHTRVISDKRCGAKRGAEAGPLEEKRGDFLLRPFNFEIFWVLGTVAFLFSFDNFCSIMD